MKDIMEITTSLSQFVQEVYKDCFPELNWRKISLSMNTCCCLTTSGDLVEGSSQKDSCPGCLK
jgi:hypothetical protein